MPAAAPINPDLIRTLFDYDPTSGTLAPKPTAQTAARKTDKRQWEVGAYRYSLHRLVWAWHNPSNPNPKYILFKDKDSANTRIENLHAQNVHPRWVGHTKQTRARMDASGNVRYEDAAFDAKFDYQ